MKYSLPNNNSNNRQRGLTKIVTTTTPPTTTMLRHHLNYRSLLCLSVLINVILLLRNSSSRNGNNTNNKSSTTLYNGVNIESITFHGGHPTAHDISGSCWCSKNDFYCMCTPAIAIDVVLITRNNTSSSSSNTDNDYYVWLVRRKDTNQLAVLGGFVKVGESVEDTVRREIQEETGIVLQQRDKTQLILYGVYSDPRRDNRRHTTSIAYAIHFDGTEKPIPNDDVKDVTKISIHDIEKHTYFADHMTLLLDYRKILLSNNNNNQQQQQQQQQQSVSLQYNDFQQSPNDFVTDIVRSVCLPLLV